MKNALSPFTGNNGDFSAGNIQPLPLGGTVELVNLNEVVHNNLIARRQKIEDLQVIVRYDALPLVKGDVSWFSKIFSLILNSILDHPPAGTKLFIYIKCEKDKSETMDLSLPEGFHNYAISVYTNITTDAHWQQSQQQNIEDIKRMVYAVNGSFDNHSIVNTGCLYQVTLPGKLL